MPATAAHPGSDAPTSNHDRHGGDGDEAFEGQSVHDRHWICRHPPISMAKAAISSQRSAYGSVVVRIGDHVLDHDGVGEDAGHDREVPEGEQIAGALRRVAPCASARACVRRRLGMNAK